MTNVHAENARGHEFDQNSIGISIRLIDSIDEQLSHEVNELGTDKFGLLMARIENEYWNILIDKAHRGCKKSYRRLLIEMNEWLTIYLADICFLGDYDGLIAQILRAVHSKAGTYNPKVGVKAWLTSIADYKVACASDCKNQFFFKN